MSYNSFRFQKFPVYGEIRKFINKIYLLVDTLPQYEKDELSSQLRRASVSISLNLAEGSAKQSDIDFNRYLLISLGSVHEAVAILDTLLDLKFIDEKTYLEYTSYCSGLAKQLYGFSRKLKSSN